jgi:glutamine amidotransferase-like uncharacterized protein
MTLSRFHGCRRASTDHRAGGRRPIGRRNLLIAAGSAGVLAGLTACGPVVSKSDPRPVALIYRGPASGADCSEAVAALLRNNPTPFRTVFCGPSESVELSPDSLATATVYAQPGGGNVDAAWRNLRQHADDIKTWVRGGGRYLGFCLGGYLAGASPGFALLPGDTNQYITSPQATVDSTDDTVVPIRWRGQLRHMYFQDAPVFRLNSATAATVLATYDTGAIAALVTSYGAGRVGVVGPHPEADQSWYPSGLTNPDGIRPDLGYDLIQTTVS